MAPRNPNEQTEPIEDGSGDASQAAKIDGILEQVRQDVGMGHVGDIEDVLRQRLDNAGIPISEEEIAELVARLNRG